MKCNTIHYYDYIRLLLLLRLCCNVQDCERVILRVDTYSLLTLHRLIDVVSYYIITNVIFFQIDRTSYLLFGNIPAEEYKIKHCVCTHSIAGNICEKVVALIPKM